MPVRIPYEVGTFIMLMVAKGSDHMAGRHDKIGHFGHAARSIGEGMHSTDWRQTLLLFLQSQLPGQGPQSYHTQSETFAPINPS